MMFSPNAQVVFADGPSSMPHEPYKAQIRQLLKQYEDALSLTAQLLSASVARATLAELNAVVGSYNNGDIGLVVLDDDLELRGVYQKVSGAWVKKADLPNEAAQIAQIALADFRTHYLGAFDTDPTTDLVGNPLIEGALYFNTTTGLLRVRHGGSWQNQSLALVDGAVTPPKLSDEVLSSIDPLRLFAGDGTTDDTARFNGLRATYPSVEFDLRGKIYAVSARPTGKWRNGFFKIGNFYYPAASIVHREYMVTFGSILRNWPQDTAHNDRGVRFVGIGAGSSHAAADNNVRLETSRNGGHGWEETTEFNGPDASHSAWCASMGVHSHRQFAIVRQADSLGNPTAFLMYSRKLYAQYKLVQPFTTVAGSNIVTITFPELHGLRTGDEINVINSGNPNGVTISSAVKYAVTRVTNGTQVTIVGSGNATSTGSGGATTGTTIHSLPSAGWTEMLFGGVSFGGAFATAVGELPVTVQSFAPYAIDRALVGISGFGSTCGFVRISGLFGNPVLVYTPFSSTVLTEPTVCVTTEQTASGRAYGLTRVQGNDTNIMCWYANNLTATPTIVTETRFSYKFGRQNPSPIRYHPETDMLYAVTSERESATQAESLLITYVMIAKRTDFEASGAAAFKVIPFGAIRAVPSGYSGSGFTYTTSNAGVPSLDIDGNTLIAYFSQEESQEDSAQTIGSRARSNIKAFEFDISTPLI
jgi:hypothetical protein